MGTYIDKVDTIAENDWLDASLNEAMVSGELIYGRFGEFPKEGEIWFLAADPGELVALLEGLI